MTQPGQAQIQCPRCGTGQLSRFQRAQTDPNALRCWQCSGYPTDFVRCNKIEQAKPELNCGFVCCISCWGRRAEKDYDPAKQVHQRPQF